MSGFQAFRILGWKGSLILLAGTVIYIVGGAALSLALDWPDSYGLHCHGRFCLVPELRWSPALLRGGSVLEYLLFAWLWLLPVGTLAAFLWAFWDARRRSRGLVYPSNSYKSE